MILSREPVATPATIEGLPRIDRYFPHCLFSAVEAVSRLLFGSGDFGKIYGRHSFQYAKPPGPIAYRDNGVELDLLIHREDVPDSELTSLVESIYAVRISGRRLSSAREHREYCLERLRRGLPVITDFDLRFIKERREYGKVSSPHIIVLTGYDPASGVLSGAEQMMGTLSIASEDFDACLRYKVSGEGGIDVFELSSDGRAERRLRRDEVMSQVDANVRNLGSAEPGLGLNALARFRDDIAAYVGSAAFDGRPFHVPGLWVFSHERHIERKWLKAARDTCGEGVRPILTELDATLERLFRAWLSTDYLLEKCLASDDGQSLRNLPSFIDPLLEDERKAADGWAQLSRQLAAG